MLIFVLSISIIGVTSAAVPVKKASSQLKTSSNLIFLSMVSIPKSLASVIIVFLVIPSRTVSYSGVINLLSLIKKMFSPEPSFTESSVPRIRASSYPDAKASLNAKLEFI